MWLVPHTCEAPAGAELGAGGALAETGMGGGGTALCDCCLGATMVAFWPMSPPDVPDATNAFLYLQSTAAA